MTFAKPEALALPKSSTDLINEHVARLQSAGVPQSAIAAALDAGPNYVSMLKKGSPLSLNQVRGFAAAARLSPEQRFELLTTRLIELHNEERRSTICFDTLLEWAGVIGSTDTDEQALLEIWRQVTVPAAQLRLLHDPLVRQRFHQALEQIVQDELRQMAEEAAAGQ